MDNRGQAVVEAALVLPLIFFVGVMYFQLLAFCHNAILLQSATAQSARYQALKDPTQSRPDPGRVKAMRMLGTVIPAQFHRNSTPLNPGRAFKGPEVIPANSRVMTAEGRSRMQAIGFFDWGLPGVPLKFSAEFPSEPPISEER